MTAKLDAVLEQLHDPSAPSGCRVFLRPSFGRAGGRESPQFGEFDFIILADKALYLGESKWDRSAEKMTGGVLQLQKDQVDRHKLFRFYVDEWAFGSYAGWRDFAREAGGKPQLKSMGKVIAPDGSLLARNLQTVLKEIRDHYGTMPRVANVLLYFHQGMNAGPLPAAAGNGFDLVRLDYSEIAHDEFVRIDWSVKNSHEKHEKGQLWE
jgi:hypothetical protein